MRACSDGTGLAIQCQWNSLNPVEHNFVASSFYQKATRLNIQSTKPPTVTWRAKPIITPSAQKSAVYPRDCLDYNTDRILTNNTFDGICK